MNTEKLNEIGNLIDEGKAYKSHIDGMEAECKSIQKYCLDALQDFHDTFCAVCELIEKNPQIARWSDDSRSAWLGNSSLTGGIGYKYHRATPECGAWVDYIRMKEHSELKGLVYWANVYWAHGTVCSPNLTEKQIVLVKQNIANRSTEGKDIGIWIKAKSSADETRMMSEVLLEGLRISAKAYSTGLKEIMNKGISAGAKKYEKVA